MNQTSLSSRFHFVLLILRVTCALPVLYHGSAILLGAFGGPGPINFAAFLHVPTAIGYLVGLAQFAGGLAILTGVFQRIGAVCVIIVMFGAIFMVHLPHGYDVGKGGMEFAVTELLLAFAILISGPGDFSLHRALPSAVHKL